MAESRWDGVDWAYTVNTRDWPPTNGQPAVTTAKGNQALKTTAFTLTVASGGTAGFEPSGHLLVDSNDGPVSLVVPASVAAELAERLRQAITQKRGSVALARVVAEAGAP